MAGASALGARCQSRAGAGQLPRALADCNEALRLQPNDGASLEARGLVHLKRADYRAALADYDAALRRRADSATSLYGRGVAKLHGGNAAGGKADIAAAKKLQRNIAERFAEYGVRG